MSVSVSETNATYNFYPTWVPSAEDWMDMFGGKADAVNGWLTNPTVLGNMTLVNPPSATTDAANKAYVDGKLSGSTIPDAPSDGTPYCRMNSTWVPAPTTITASVIGDLLVPGNLTVGLNAVIDGNLQLGTTSNGAFKLDVNGPMNVEGSGSFTVDGITTYLMVTSNALANPPVLPNTALRIVGADTLFPRISVDSFGGNGQLSFRKANGTAAAPTALPSNTLIGSMNYLGYDGSGYSAGSQASIGGWSDGAWSPTSHPTRFSWFVTPINSLTLGEVMRLASSGDLLIGGTLTDAGYKLDVKGAARIDSGSGGAFPAGMAGNLIVSGADASQPVIAVGGFGTGVQGTVNFYRAQGTRAAPTGMTGVLGQIVAFGYGATGLSAASRVGIQFVSQEAAAWTDTAQGASIAFRTTPIGTITTAETMRLAASGNLLIGSTVDDGLDRLQVAGGARFTNDGGVTSSFTVTANTTAAPALPANTLLSIVGANAAIPRLLFDSFGAYSQISHRSSGGTAAAPTALPSGQSLGTHSFLGYDGAAYSVTQGTFICATDAAWTPTSHPTRFTWSTTPAGSVAAPLERMRLTNAGNLLIASTADNGVDRLQVAGSARISTGLGVWGHVAPAAQPSFTGAKGGNTALASVIAVLVAAGFALDTTTA